MAFPSKPLFPSLWTNTVEHQIPSRVGLWDLPLEEGEAAEAGSAPQPQRRVLKLFAHEYRLHFFPWQINKCIKMHYFISIKNPAATIVLFICFYDYL